MFVYKRARLLTGMNLLVLLPLCQWVLTSQVTPTWGHSRPSLSRWKYHLACYLKVPVECGNSTSSFSGCAEISCLQLQQPTQEAYGCVLFTYFAIERVCRRGAERLSDKVKAVDCILSHINGVQSFETQVPKIRFNIILPSVLRARKWTVSSATSVQFRPSKRKYLRSILILSFHLCFDHQSDVFP
jgi:hypothetical protein